MMTKNDEIKPKNILQEPVDNDERESQDEPEWVVHDAVDDEWVVHDAVDDE
jgi:hypothetical protein